MATVVCPYCFHEINNSRLAYQCAGAGAPGRTACERGTDTVRFDLTGFLGEVYPTFVLEQRGLISARRVECPDCGGPTGQRACQVCHTPLPSTFAQSRSPLLGMVGGTSSGKSVYLTVLEHELRRKVAMRFRADVRLAGDQQAGAGSPKAWLRENEQRLFDDGEMVRKTDATIDGRREPLVLEWRQPRTRFGRTDHETTTLSFYDASGEDFLNQATTHLQRYLGVAGGLILMLDPWQLPGLRGLVDVPANVKSEEPISVLNRITELLRTSHGTHPRKKVDVPLAVVFSKFDEVFGLLDPADPLFAVPPATSGYDEAAGQTMHEQVRSLLHLYDAADIDLHLSGNYKSFRFFAVSALGAAPDYTADKVDAGGVRPFRVDEPLLWLLHRLGVVDRVRA